MRYIVNSKNYVIAVGFGAGIIFANSNCTEYTGAIPSGWSSLEEWYEEEGEKLWRWKIVRGNLTIDSSATPPEEGRWGVPKLQSKIVTPTAAARVISPDAGYDGLSMVSIMGDSDLKAENIKSGVKIFDVTGTLSGNVNYVQQYIGSGSSLGNLPVDGLGRSDGQPPMYIYGFCASSASVTSFRLSRSGSNWYANYWNTDGFSNTSTAGISISGTNITLWIDNVLFSSATYYFFAIWEE